MATTHSVNSLVETNTQRSDSASELAPAQPPGFLGPRVVRKRDRWSDGESDSMAPPAKRPEPDAISDIGAPSELGANASRPRPRRRRRRRRPEDATVAETRHVRLALDAHARSARRGARRRRAAAAAAAEPDAQRAPRRRRLCCMARTRGRRAELPRAARAARARGPVATRPRARARGGLGAERPLWGWWWTVRTGRRLRRRRVRRPSPRLPSAWLRRIRRASSARLRQLRPAARAVPAARLSGWLRSAARPAVPAAATRLR